MTSKAPAKPATATKAPALIIGSALIQKAIDSIGKRQTNLLRDIQKAGLSIISHVDQHADTTLADRLFNAMGKGSRRVSLAQWFITYGKMRLLDKAVPEEAAAIKAGRIFQFDKARTTDLMSAAAMPWQNMQKEQAVKDVFDVHAAYLSLMKRIQAAQKSGAKIEHIEWVAALSAVKVPEAETK